MTRYIAGQLSLLIFLISADQSSSKFISSKKPSQLFYLSQLPMIENEIDSIRLHFEKKTFFLLRKRIFDKDPKGKLPITKFNDSLLILWLSSAILGSIKPGCPAIPQGRNSLQVHESTPRLLGSGLLRPEWFRIVWEGFSLECLTAFSAIYWCDQYDRWQVK